MNMFRKSEAKGQRLQARESWPMPVGAQTAGYQQPAAEAALEKMPSSWGALPEEGKSGYPAQQSRALPKHAVICPKSRWLTRTLFWNFFQFQETIGANAVEMLTRWQLTDRR